MVDYRFLPRDNCRRNFSFSPRTTTASAQQRLSPFPKDARYRLSALAAAAVSKRRRAIPRDFIRTSAAYFEAAEGTRCFISRALIMTRDHHYAVSRYHLPQGVAQVITRCRHFSFPRHISGGHDYDIATADENYFTIRLYRRLLSRHFTTTLFNFSAPLCVAICHDFSREMPKLSRVSSPRVAMTAFILYDDSSAKAFR